MADQAEKLKDLAANKPVGRGGPVKKVRVITITSGKGGVGKTNLTVNLALALARMNKKVAIFDADFGMANVDILLGMIPRHNMYHVVRGEKTLQDIILDGPLGVKVVPGSTGFMEMANLNSAQRRQLLKQLMKLEETVDTILIDTGAGLSKSVLGFITAAHDVLLVTNPEPTSITDAYSIAKVMGQYKLHQEVNLVLNQVRNSQEGQEVADRFSRVTQNYLQLSVNYMGCILSDPVVPRSVREQNPFYVSFPRSKAAEGIAGIAVNLVGGPRGAVRERGGLGGFFNKLSKIFS